MPAAYLYFDVAFVVVLSSLLVQGWTVALAARKLDMSFARNDPLPRRVELDLPGQLAREIVGYPVPANSPFLRRGLIPNWARPTMVVRAEEILTPREAHPIREGDYVYLLAPPEKAQALDRFFVDLPPPRTPDPLLLGDFFVPASATLGALAEIYGLQVAAAHTEITLADYFADQLGKRIKVGDVVELGPIALLAHQAEHGPRHHRRPAAGRAGRAGRFTGAAQILLAEDLGALGLGRAPHQRRRVLHQPGAAEQHRHPEQVAEHRAVEEGQRRDVALREALQTSSDTCR